MNNFSNFRSKYLILILLCGFNFVVYSQAELDSEIKIINDSDLLRILVEEKGSAVLINVWATWCAPCREEFPDLVKLSNDYRNQIRFIGISADEVEDIDDKVIPFLKSQNAQFENYLIKVSDPEDFINALNIDWSGAIPATFIYDKNGLQSVALIGKQSYNELNNEIKKVID